MSLLSTKLTWDLASVRWPSILNPIISIPMLSGIPLNNISLVINKPLAINHLLQRMQQGWIVTDNTGNAVVWRTQPFNQTTLTLESDANTTISLWVF